MRQYNMFLSHGTQSKLLFCKGHLVETSVLNTIGIIGVLLSAIPFGTGILFIVLPIFSKFGSIGLLYLPAYIVYGLFKHHEDVEYGVSLFWRSGIFMFPSILLIKYF